jgi:uncharacterized membrane protein YtjA (UPF0391 family)
MGTLQDEIVSERRDCVLVGSGKSQVRKRGIMLYYAAVFFIIALVAAAFGFFGIAAGAASIAKILFFIFLIGAIVTLLISRGRV